jgi:hypothetical protein
MPGPEEDDRRRRTGARHHLQPLQKDRRIAGHIQLDRAGIGVFQAIEAAGLVAREGHGRRLGRQLAEAVQERREEPGVDPLAEDRRAGHGLVVADPIPTAPFPEERLPVLQQRQAAGPLSEIPAPLHGGRPAVDEGARHPGQLRELGEIPDGPPWPPPPAGLGPGEEPDLQEPLVEVAE